MNYDNIDFPVFVLHTDNIELIDGILWIDNQVLDDTIELMLVPHTLKATNLKNLKAGDNLNIEFDHLAKIVAHQLKTLQKHQLSLEAAIKTS